MTPTTHTYDLEIRDEDGEPYIITITFKRYRQQQFTGAFDGTEYVDVEPIIEILAASYDVRQIEEDDRLMELLQLSAEQDLDG